MSDDNRYYDENSDEYHDDEANAYHAEHNADGVSPSVTFMEMMRRAASQPPEETLADELFATRKSDGPPSDNPNPSDESPLASELFARLPQEEGQPVQQQTRTYGELPAFLGNEPFFGKNIPEEERQQRYEAALEQQRVRRVQRRRARRRRRTVGVLGGIMRSVIVVGAAAVLMATIFTWWTPTQFIADDVREELSVAMATSQATPVPTALATPNWLKRVGVVSGHRGPENDPGAVCPDGLTEREINEEVAQIVVRNLRSRGYTVDLLDEFDPRLDSYQAAALISIHANSCAEFSGERPSGYLIAGPAARASSIGLDRELVECVAEHYGKSTDLVRREGVTVDMTHYHNFREIHELTPAVILELGFMLADRDILTTKSELLADGITDGLVCFMEPGSPEANLTTTPAAPEADEPTPAPEL